MTQAEYIISKFGGIHPMARVINRRASTVQGWMERGSIPERNWREILELASSAKVELKREDFVAHLPAEHQAA
jgi:hypothetical protein